MNNLLCIKEMTLPLGSLDAYIQRVQAVPVLTLEAEQALTHRLVAHNDLEAARQLITAHLRFVVRIARGYNGYGLALADLIQEGNIGLMKAVKRFNPEVGVRLVSFAVHWIKAEIHEFIVRNWRIVKIATTKAQRKLFFNLRQTKKRLGWFNKKEIEEVAYELGVSEESVREMEMRLSATDPAFDVLTADDEDADHAPMHFLADDRYDPAQQLETTRGAEHAEQNLQTALAKLDPRRRHIVSERWLSDKKATLQELATHYQVSEERIRQLEQTALKQLKDTLGPLINC